MTGDRRPPSSIEDEKAVLGAALLPNADALALLLTELDEDDFYQPAHRTVYRAIRAVHTRGGQVDALAVNGELQRTRELADIGGAPFLHTLIAAVPTAAHAGQSTTRVAELGGLRRILDAAAQIQQAVFEDPDHTGRAVAHAQAVIHQLTAASNGAAGSRLLARLRNGAWLDAQQFPPLAYTVPGVIPEGSVLLVGPPKIGKSWLVLAIALAAAAGGRALGLQVAKRPVLYLALEDGDRRMQDRCRKLLGDGVPIPPDFEYQTEAEPGRILDTVAAWLARHRTADASPLVILDTLGKVMPPALLGESAYQRDYRIGSQLKQLADRHPGASILTNHHDRKAGAEDFIDSVSGTHGLAGAADTILIITRPRLAAAGLLKVTGRDVPEGEYAVRFVDGATWTLDGVDLAEAARRAREAQATAGLGDRSVEIIGAVAQLGRATPAAVAAQLRMDPVQVRVYLRRLAERNRLVQPGRGVYALPPDPCYYRYKCY
jgi:hypothetical protein